MRVTGWIEGIQRAIDHIEENLMDDLDIADIAACSYVSAFHFQRIFSVLCGITVGEYIRNRRLTLAAQELSGAGAKVIDTALKYGYDSPDSFSRAFARFHGMPPSAAMKKGVRLRAYAPLRIKIRLEGGTMLDYKIMEKAAFTVMGRQRRFNMDTCYDEIPAFWSEHNGGAESQVVCGMYGVCIDSSGKEFDYLIADNYLPWSEVPEGYVTRVIPAGTWAVFPWRGLLPRALQSVNSRIWSEWPGARCQNFRGFRFQNYQNGGF